MKVKAFIQLLLLPLPWCIRRPLLCAIFGYSIHPTAHIGWSIVIPRKLIMEKNAKIFNYVTCKPIDLLCLREEAAIGKSTRITGFPTSEPQYYSHIKDRKCQLVLGKCATITAGHYIDCNEWIEIGEFTTLAGGRSHLMTHSIDVYKNRQDARPIRIGKYCFVGSDCLFLPGSQLPDYSILGARSVLNKIFTKESCVYAGAPASLKKEIPFEEVEYFHRTARRVL